MGGPRGYQKCRRCRQSKLLSAFPSSGRTCSDCMAKDPNPGQHKDRADPFRYGVDVKGLDRFLRLPVIFYPEDPRDA